MAIEYDKQIWCSQDPVSSHANARNRPDWHGLRGRFIAARDLAGGAAISAALELEDSEADLAGSFHAQAARRIDAFANAARFVNSNDSANRNAGGCKVKIVADEFSCGDRG